MSLLYKVNMTEMIKYRHAVSHLYAADGYARNSYAKRLQVGAVLVKGDIPIALGWNGRLPGQPNACEDTMPDGSTKTRTDVRHAEINALNKLHRSNESAEGSVMFCTHAACIQCAADMVQAGVKGFVYTNDYRDMDGIEYLLKNGVIVYRIDKEDPELGTQIHRFKMTDANHFAQIPWNDNLKF